MMRLKDIILHMYRYHNYNINCAVTAMCGIVLNGYVQSTYHELAGARNCSSTLRLRMNECMNRGYMGRRGEELTEGQETYPKSM